MGMCWQRRHKNGIDSKMVIISSIVSDCHQAWDDPHCTPRDVPHPHRLLHRHGAPGTAGFQGLYMKNKGIAGIT